MSNEEKILQILTQIQGDITDLKGDVIELKGDVIELKSGQAKLETGQAKLEAGQSQMQGVLETLVFSVNDLAVGQENLRAHVTKIELDNKEAHSAIYGKLDAIEERLDAAGVR